MHKTFISYHHDNEQKYKEDIIKDFGEENFIDKSVGDGEIDTDLDESKIMEIIRTDYLQDSTVTLVLVGSETAERPSDPSVFAPWSAFVSAQGSCHHP